MMQRFYSLQFRRGGAQLLSVMVPVLLMIGCSSTPIGSGSAKDASHKPVTSATSKGNANSAPALPPAGSGRGGYYRDDGPGEKPPADLQAIPDAEPKVEHYSATGNRPYVVFGKTYTPLTDSKPFKQRGIGSWYGKKFHGQKTSSGELYDMYKMTAAHPTLPIPSYARVTNVANGQQVIVRVNDRGPFHANRIIDLSYTAALKLGYLGTGSSELEVERLLPDDIARIKNDKQENPGAVNRPPSTPQSAISSVGTQTAVEAMLRNDANPTSPSSGATQPDSDLASAKPASITVNSNAQITAATTSSGFYIQLGAYSQSDRADAVRAHFQKQWAGNLPAVEIAQSGALYRLYCGPFNSKEEASSAAQKLQENSSGKLLIVER